MYGLNDLDGLKRRPEPCHSMAAADAENLRELLTMLGLVRLSPMLDREWQTL